MNEPDDRVPLRPEPIIPIRRVLPPQRRRGKNRKYHSTTPAESSSKEEMTIGHKGRVPKDMEKKKMNTNPPSYVCIRPIINDVRDAECHLTPRTVQLRMI